VSSADDSKSPQAADECERNCRDVAIDSSGESARKIRWAALLQRVFEIDALRCPRCGSTMRLIAAIEDPDVARHILECLKLPARAPPLGDATAAPEEPEWTENDRPFDQSPPYDEA